MIYGNQILNSASINQGKKQLAEQLSICIDKCGMFVDEEFPFLGASPDGLVGIDTLVEIRCP